MRTVTVALDGTEFGERALVLGARLAQATNTKLRLAHIASEPGYEPETNAAWYVREVASRLMSNEQVDVEVRVGDPAEELVRLTEESTDGALVMATHGRGTIGRLVHGSVARDVLLGAKSPVLLVREDTSQQPTDPMTLLVPLDGSEIAEDALSAAAVIAQDTG
ncbi:MAG: universal stress protein, partial [Chloroflexota bacterium]